MRHIAPVDATLQPTPEPTPWWGEYALEAGSTGLWQIGPLRLWITNRRHEWRLYFERGPDALDPSVAIVCPLAEDDGPPETAERTRMATQRTGGTLSLEPALADRAVVSRPESPFQLLPNDAVDLFVSTPLWLRVWAGPEPRHLLWDQPLFRPSDTWVGPDTTRGALAYASRTFMRLDASNLPYYAARAVTRIRLENRAAGPLLLERLSLPVRELALYADARGRLLTETMTLTREPGGDLAAVRVEHGAPDRRDADEGPRLVAEPRDTPRRGGILHALSSLLG
jgi:hypothetical protein